MINLLTLNEISRAAVLSVLVFTGIAGGFWIAWFTHKDIIIDLRKQIKERTDEMLEMIKDKYGH